MSAMSNATVLPISCLFGIGLEAAETPGTLVPPTIGFAVQAPALKDGFNREKWEGLWGSIVRPKQLEIRTTTTPDGTFVVPVSNENATLLLQLASGTAATPFVPAATLGTFSLCMELAGIAQRQHTGCKVNQITFEASETEQILRATVEYLAMAATLAASEDETIPDYLVTQAPYLFGGCTLSLDGDTFKANRLRLAIRNNLMGDHLQNSLTRLKIPEGEREVDGEIDVDFNADTYAAFVAEVAANAGVALVATFANGSYTLAFTVADITFPEDTLGLDVGRQMTVTLPFHGRASAVGETDLYSIAVANPA